MIKWEKELLLLESTRKRRIFGVDAVVAIHTMLAINDVPLVVLEEAKRSHGIAGKIKRSTKSV